MQGVELKKPDVSTIHFRSAGGVHFDARTYSIKDDTVPLYSLTGRQIVKMALGDFQSAYLAAGNHKPKEAKLVRRDKQWFFNLVLDFPEARPSCGGGVLGIDL